MEEELKFSEIIPIRVRKQEKADINRSINQNTKYENISHFIRCAMMKLIRDELK